MAHTEIYIERLKQIVYMKISSEISLENLEIVMEDLNFHLRDNTSSKFQDYYFKTLTNESYFFDVSNFFREFKTMYSLQGIDEGFLNYLEGIKIEILDFIKSDNLSGLYFKIFNRAKVKYRDGTIEKDLASFFAKFVHTFRPAKYCALDNLVKKYLGLTNEGFFISFIVLSETYKLWAIENAHLIKHIRASFKELDSTHRIKHDEITDFKLLDLIFWRKADKAKKEKQLTQKKTTEAKAGG